VTRVLITHADEPIGRRVVKRLFHDPRVDAIFAVGDGPTPRSFDRYLAGDGPAVSYARVDLARHRAASDLFHSPPFRSAQIDTVVHLPRHGSAPEAPAPLVAGLSERTAETRLVVQHCLELASVTQLVALGSAFVYQLHPGNANRFTEDSPLDLDPDVSAEIRTWIDADMIVHGELHNERLRVVLLRAPSVVAAGGYVYMNPALPIGAPSARVLGFDPICAVISDKDVARAVQAAVHARRSGIYNVAGREAVPLSVLARWTGRRALPVPHPLLGWASAGARLLGLGAEAIASRSPALRYGFTLDTRRAERDLDFRPGDRIGLAREGDGSLRLETASSALA
jgi:nucleoside-diphosphate-sugar epimerase